MNNIRPQIFSPKNIATKDRNVAYQLLISSTSTNYKDYADRFFFDKEMEKIWKSFNEKGVSNEVQFLLFWNIHSTISHWASCDKRSDNEKKEQMAAIVRAAKQLNRLLADPYNIKILIRRELTRSLREIEEKSKIDKAVGIKYQDTESLRNLCEDLRSIAARGERIIKKGAISSLENFSFEMPKHKNRKTAFRNLLVDRMCLFYNDRYLKRPEGLTTKFIAQIATIISGHLTREEDVKDRIKQLRKHSGFKNTPLKQGKKSVK